MPINPQPTSLIGLLANPLSGAQGRDHGCIFCGSHQLSIPKKRSNPKKLAHRAVPVQIPKAFAVESLLHVVELLEHPRGEVVHQAREGGAERGEVLVH
eukprot:817757-Prorocentrum_minimum.AAC.6